MRGAAKAASTVRRAAAKDTGKIPARVAAEVERSARARAVTSRPINRSPQLRGIRKNLQSC